MKTENLVVVGFLILLTSPNIFAEDYKKEIPLEDASKVYCATWLVETGLVLHKLVYNTDGTYAYYYSEI